MKALCVLQAMLLWAYATSGKRMGSTCLAALTTQAQTQLPQFKS